MAFDISENRNYTSYKFFEANFARFCDTCRPLVKLLNLKHFSYLKLFKDGKYLSFMNSKEWQKYYLQEIHSTFLILPGEVPLQYAGRNKEYLISTWSTTPGTKVIDIALQNGFGEGICVTKYSPEFSERWTFFRKPSSLSISVLVIQYISLILKYLEYFNLSNQDLIQIGLKDDEKLASFKKGIIYPDALPTIEIKTSIDEFLKEISVDNISQSHIQVGNYRLSKREFQCLSHLAKGENYKEIARNLNLSPRTVEEFIIKLKYKTGYRLRSNLVKLLQDNFY